MGDCRFVAQALMENVAEINNQTMYVPSALIVFICTYICTYCMHVYQC